MQNVFTVSSLVISGQIHGCYLTVFARNEHLILLDMEGRMRTWLEEPLRSEQSVLLLAEGIFKRVRTPAIGSSASSRESILPHRFA